MDLLKTNETKAKDENVISDNPAVIAAQKYFGIEYLYPWQQLVISNILEAEKYLHSQLQDSDIEALGKQIVLLPTGAGKSLCFLIPAMLLPGATLVMYPLLALMSDQKRRMDEGGISNVVFCGGQSEQEREENFKRIKAGAKIILANPEVLQNEALVKRLAECNIVHAAIDEAHCVSEWGDSFRPAYLTLGKILQKLKIPLITAFTATASPAVLNRVAEVLFDGKAHLVRSESDRPNIHYNVIYSYAKDQQLLELVQTQRRPIIIFCGTRNRTEQTARLLREFFSVVKKTDSVGTDDKGKDISFENSPEIVRFYHAGLSRDEKTETEKWFFPKENAVLCCTCAFGMGVDKKNVRTVIHRDVPLTVESFIQESGRGARDGGIAESFLLWNYADYEKFSSFPYGSRERVLLQFAQASDCRRQVLLDALGAEQAACAGCDICRAKGLISGEQKNQSGGGISFWPQKINLKKSSGKNLKHSENHFVPPDYRFAWDRNFVLKKLKYFNRSWNLDEACAFLQKKLNETACVKIGANTWQNPDLKEILNQLFAEQKIYICRWPFKNKIAVPGKKRKTAV